MKKNIIYIVAAIAFTLFALPNTAKAQYLGGVAVTATDMGPLDMLSLSQYNTPLTTARATAMGGAFTSLGGDLASMSINPAGIGMYRGSAYGFSPAMNFSYMDNSFSPGKSNTNRFSVNNIGMVANTYLSSNKLTSFNLGFSYNKLADFNNSYEVAMPSGGYSIGEIFAYQLNGLMTYMRDGNWNWGGLQQKDILRSADPMYNEGLVYMQEWGAVMAFNNGLVSSTNPNDMDWDLYAMNYVTDVNSNMRVESRGSVGEYNFAGGWNIDNKLYLGVTVSMQDIYRAMNIYYSESYGRNDNLRSMDYNQQVKMSGVGVNFKLGAIYRPIPSLRIGLAVHTPSWTSITHEYYGEMTTTFALNKSNFMKTPLNYYDVNFNSPTRLLAGISYTLGDYAAFALDYELAAYNGMRLTNGLDQEREGFKNEIKELYKPSHNLKAGIEVKPDPRIALRAGYSYYGSPLKYPEDRYSKFILNETHNLSAGLGFRLGRNTSLDFAYVYSMNKYAKSDIFYYEGGLRRWDDAAQEVEITDTGNDPLTTKPSPIDDLRLDRHSVVMTIGFHF